MREKFIDSALLAGMVIICVVILYTLFSPPTRNFGRTTTNPQDEARIDVVPPDEVTSPLTANDETETELPEVASSETAESDPSNIIPISPLEEDETNNEPSLETTESEAPLGEVEVLPPDGSVSTETSPAETSAVETSAVETASLRDNDSSETGEESSVTETLTEEASLEPPPPVPAGSFALERIGFSFVTGGAGACSIVLEAWRHVAVSRDILERYGCGSEVTIVLDDPVDGRQELSAIVADTMNPVNSRTVNIYVGADEPALEYGINTGTLEP